MKTSLLDRPVDFDDRAFRRSGKDSFQVDWADVRRITGYKIDLLTWDEIRMNFDLVGGTTVVITEESPGFIEFMREVEQRFPTVRGWHAKISQVAFTENRTVLHESPLQPGTAADGFAAR